MKKLLFISLAFLASYNIAQAQEQIYWSEVSMEVEPGDQGQVYEAVNNFYSNLEFPENEFLLFVSSITFNQLTFIFCFCKYMTWRFDNGK